MEVAYNGRGNGSCSGNLTTQFATEFESFVFLVTGNLVYKCQFVCRDGSQVPAQIRGLKTTWSGKLSDSYTTAVYIYVLQNWKKEL